MKELARLGHDVTLLGHKDCDVEKYGIKLIPLEGPDLRDHWERHIPEDTDIVHIQYNFKKEINKPFVCTVHGNGQPDEKFNFNSVFVSKAHARLHGSKTFVHNALDFEEYPCPENIENKGKDQLLFLAKASWKVKNLKDCVKAAKKTKKHLHIAGGRTFSLSRYIHNHGFIGGEEKLELLRKCDALVFPVRWPEPFGIAMIEAMSQGLPVFGSSYGSLPEVIGKAGKACSNYSEFFTAVQNFECDLNPREIRDYAKSKFSINSYSLSYLKIYEDVINGKKLNEKHPQLTTEDKAEALLIF